MPTGPARSTASLLERLRRGDAVDDGDLLRVLRRADCPAGVVEEMVRSGQGLQRRGAVESVVRHPSCPVAFALDAVQRLGWRELVRVANDPRARPPVRVQAERRLLERIPALSLGERTSLARVAPRGVLAVLLGDAGPRCIEALLDNPRFTEAEATRIFVANPTAACLLAVLRHPLWGARPNVRLAALQARAVPVPVALGLAVTFSDQVLGGLVAAENLREEIREGLRDLLERRGSGGCPDHSRRRA